MSPVDTPRRLATSETRVAAKPRSITTWHVASRISFRRCTTLARFTSEPPYSRLTRALGCPGPGTGAPAGGSTMDLNEIKAEGQRLSPWPHLATVGADGKPDVVPVQPSWEGDTLWVMAFEDSVKCRNIAHQPEVALHWQVPESGDGLELWGAASVHTDLDTKRRLWTGVFDYDINLFVP